MKKVFLMTMLMLLGSIAANAQKYALIDMEYILKKIPAYERANEQLDQTSKQWQAEVDNARSEAKSLYESYQNSGTSLGAEQKKKKENEIIAKENEANELKMKYFGSDGELYKKRESLMKPIQNQIYNAVKAISESQGYSMVIDRASAQNIIFASPKIDISDEIIAKLGYSSNN
jgi:outer membrane protein